MWMQPHHRNAYCLVSCILFVIVALFWCGCSQTIGIHMVWRHVSCLLLWSCFVWMQPNHWNSHGLVTCILFTIVALIGVNATKHENSYVFGDVYLVCHCCLISGENEPNHKNSYDLLTCILFSVLALSGVNAAKPWEIIWFADMHPIRYCGHIWCECSRTAGIHMDWWHVSCLSLWPYFDVDAGCP